MLIDFCRKVNCRIRQIIDKPNQAGHLTPERVKEILEGSACVNCRAWQYERFQEGQEKK